MPHRSRTRSCSARSFLGPSRYNGDVSFRVRDFRKTDFETLWRIDQACFDPQLAYSRMELALYMRRPWAFTLVVESDGEEVPGSASARIIAFIVAEAHRKTGHIVTIDVIAEARREGIGSRLVLEAEKRLKQAGAMLVELETPVNNASAIRFYKAMGYCVERTITGYYSNQMDALVMRKELEASG